MAQVEKFDMLHYTGNLYVQSPSERQPTRAVMLLLHASLLHLQLQQLGFGTAGRADVVPLVLVVGITAFIQLINHFLAFLFFVIVLHEAVWIC
jgi:hypothetical protein